MPDKKNNKW